MPASFWDMSNWYNWYWWPLYRKNDRTVVEETSIPVKREHVLDEKIITFADMNVIEEELEQKTETQPQLKENIEEKEEIISIPKESPDKSKRKRKTASKSEIVDSEKSIQLVLRPNILEELEKEALVSDSTLNQLIQVILEAHVESKDDLQIQSEPWHCSFCNPQEEFSDYFKFSEHFFAKHMQPGLEKLSENKQELNLN
ncbi:MAG TPA: hypothetical protein VH562_04845 [Nitrosopumilaceae archaeon]|jgi:hypothetical protein